MKVECDRFERWASLYRDYRLPGRARTAVERHLSYCQTCAARYAILTGTLDTLRPEPTASGLIPADVTHALPPRRDPLEPGRWKGRLRRLGLWVAGLVMLAALLAAAFILGFRSGVRATRPTDPAPTVKRDPPRRVVFSVRPDPGQGRTAPRPAIAPRSVSL